MISSKPSQPLGIYIGESFAEFSTAHQSKRVYLPKDPLKKSLPLWLKTLNFNESTTDLDVRVSYGFLERILSYKLGGTLAVLVTDGFEKWVDLRETAPWQNSMSNPDLLFPIRERISASGEVIESLDLTALEAIGEKLAQLSVKRVSVQFLHSNINRSHQELAENFFQKKGYEIFSPGNGADEAADWRRSLLDAGLSGTFEELTRELVDALNLSGFSYSLQFHSSMGGHYAAGSDSDSAGSPQNESSRNAKTRRVETMLSHYELAAEFLRRQGFRKGFYFGIEGFCEIEADIRESHWNSPWGKISVDHPRFRPMPIQPTSVLDVDRFGDLSFRAQGMGFEPGPICFGRGQSYQWIDLFSEEIKSLEIQSVSDLIVSQPQAKTTGTLMSLRKSAAHNSRDNQALLDFLKQQTLQLLLSRTLLCNESLIFGPLSPLIARSKILTRSQYASKVAIDSTYALSKSLL